MNTSLAITPDDLSCPVQPAHLRGMLRGIERETLRMQSNGYLSQQPHPQALGAALTHPSITTDYSEALLEFITPPTDQISTALADLEYLHRFTQQHLPQGERLWPLSMPCMLDDDEERIVLAQYGSSHLGRFKTLYRRGLGVRYGRRMQTIAGVHYNVSFPDALFADLQQQETDPDLKTLSAQDYRSARYFGLIRNFIRHIPLVMYLLGASPTACRCFVTDRTHYLQPLDQGTLYLPYATALRMGRLGYQNSAQRSLGIHYNDLNGYLAGIRRAIATPYAPFEALGIDDEHGEPLQINANVLQIENEYYSLIRPKQPPLAGESPADALAARGVAYVELRAVDIDPYSPVGISAESAAFLETLALYCLLLPSPPISPAEQQAIEDNQAQTVDQGRDPELMLNLGSHRQRLRDWMTFTLQAMQPLARQLADSRSDPLYDKALNLMQQRVEDVSLTPSARVLADTQAAGSSWKMGAALAERYAADWQMHPLSVDQQHQLEQVATESWRRQRQLEQANQQDFTSYLQAYRGH